MDLRAQLQDSSVRVVGIAPPTVRTELHRERSDPDDNKKEKNTVRWGWGSLWMRLLGSGGGG
ncbi:hypothetical protein GQ44DRAFT_717631 [Phaeosphaeriaceae sp. PMI808]|nr:hypothetical protein GQ44DRAFT_717631 [Phaeosphaeriaceae sp. PMI808]